MLHFHFQRVDTPIGQQELICWRGYHDVEEFDDAKSQAQMTHRWLSGVREYIIQGREPEFTEAARVFIEYVRSVVTCEVVGDEYAVHGHLLADIDTAGLLRGALVYHGAKEMQTGKSVRFLWSPSLPYTCSKDIKHGEGKLTLLV